MTSADVPAGSVVQRVRDRLAAEGISGVQQQADAVGLNRETWRKIRKGESVPQPDNLSKLREYLAGPEPYASHSEALAFAAEKIQAVADELRALATRSGEAAAKGARASQSRKLVEESRAKARDAKRPKRAEG